MRLHLLLGDPQDPLCLSVRDELESRNYPTRNVSNPVLHPSRFSWRLSSEESASQLTWADADLLGEQVAGVLVRTPGWIDPEGWQPDDLAYMQTESQAALLAWLSSLDCPVVNRYPPGIWYQRQAPLLSWHPLLRRCGLPTVETLVTNVEEEARTFGRRLSLAGAPGVIYGPLTSSARYVLDRDEDWSGVALVQRCTPVSLTAPHGAPQFVCVAGERVIWEGNPPAEAASLEPALRRFANSSGLAFVELALAPAAQGICVIAVEPDPRFEHFGIAAQREISRAVAQLLTAESRLRPKDGLSFASGSRV